MIIHEPFSVLLNFGFLEISRNCLAGYAWPPSDIDVLA